MTDHEKGGKGPPFFIAQTDLSPKQIYRVTGNRGQK